MDINPDKLPVDAAALRQMVMGLLQELDANRRQLMRVQHLLEQLLRWRYGQKRERVDENQFFLFAVSLVNAGKDQATLAALAAQESISAAASVPPTSKRKSHGRRYLPKSLERRRVVYDLGEQERQCPHCQSELRRIGEEISERLEYAPASLYVIEEVSQKYACAKGCTVVTAEKPMAPIEKGLPGPGLLAHVAVSKFGDHLPLYRQEWIYQRQGVKVSRKTMCDWMRQCTQLVSPLFDRMKQRVLSSKVMQTDDTPVAVLDSALPRTRLGRIWTYVGDNNHPYTVYDYTPNRSRDGPNEFLNQFRGFLQADAYSGYDQLYQNVERGVIEVACWAHARRKFYEAQSSDLMRSMVMLAYIRLLYDVERTARDRHLNSEQLGVLRQQHSRPILDDIQVYLETEQSKVLPKSPEGQAIAYALSNWPALMRYCEDGDLEIGRVENRRSGVSLPVGFGVAFASPPQSGLA